MDKYIVALLNANLRVIIPDFGAFIIRQKEPKIVVFNEFLKYNDGLLFEYMLKTEGTEFEIARQHLASYTENAIKVLETGGIFTIEGLGRLQKDRSSKVIFTPENEYNSGESVQKVSEEPVPAQHVSNEPAIQIEKDEPVVKSGTKPARKRAPKPRIQKAPEPESLGPVHTEHREITVGDEIPFTIVDNTSGADIVNNVPEAEIVKDEETVSETITAPETDAALNIEDLSDAPHSAEEKIVEPEVVVNESYSVKEIINAPVEIQPLAESPAVSESPAGIGSDRILKWVVIILSVNVVILAWFLFKDDIRSLFKNKEEPLRVTDSVLQQLSDSVMDAAVDTSMIFSEAVDSAAFAESAPAQGNLRYYIVAGCFRDESNADELVKSLKSNGFKAEKFGKIGNLYAVCFVSFDDKELAVKELKRIREEIHPEAWMTRF